jgi:hypothetical protein
MKYPFDYSKNQRGHKVARRDECGKCKWVRRAMDAYVGASG